MGYRPMALSDFRQRMIDGPHNEGIEQKQREELRMSSNMNALKFCKVSGGKIVQFRVSSFMGTVNRAMCKFRDGSVIYAEHYYKGPKSKDYKGFVKYLDKNRNKILENERIIFTIRR